MQRPFSIFFHGKMQDEDSFLQWDGIMIDLTRIS